VFLLSFLKFSEFFCKYPNGMVGVALYFRFYIMYTCVYLNNVQKRERKHAG